MTIDTDDIMDAHDVCEFLSVPRNQLRHYQNAVRAPFPEPFRARRSYGLWVRQDVLMWCRDNSTKIREGSPAAAYLRQL